jgi:hypothetical protein
VRTSPVERLLCEVPRACCKALGVRLGVRGAGERMPRGTSCSGVSTPKLLSTPVLMEDRESLELGLAFVSVSADRIESRVISEPISSLWLNGSGGTRCFTYTSSTLSDILAERLLLLREECRFLCLRSSSCSSREVCDLRAAAVRPAPANPAKAASRTDVVLDFSLLFLR